eukprot:1143391-Pelagomonas_calceolata.AAC.13
MQHSEVVHARYLMLSPLCCRSCPTQALHASLAGVLNGACWLADTAAAATTTTAINSACIAQGGRGPPNQQQRQERLGQPPGQPQIAGAQTQLHTKAWIHALSALYYALSVSAACVLVVAKVMSCAHASGSIE